MRRLLELGSTPADAPELRVRKRFLVVASLLGVLFLSAMTLACASRNALEFALVAGLLACTLVINLMLFAKHGSFPAAVYPALLATWLGPVFAACLDGNVALGLVPLIWTLVPPLAAALVLSAAAAWLWLLLSVLSILVFSWWFPALPPPGPGTEFWVRSSPLYNHLPFGALVVLCVGYLQRERQRMAAALALEHERSEQLLLNVLPKSIADRLKGSNATIADQFDDVTILFADIVGFTALSSQVPAARVVQMLDELFTAFDALAEQHGLEKIKTIGDAYMAVSGLPTPRADHAEAAAAMALQMLESAQSYRERSGLELHLRVGLNSGPVVAGVIGRKKFIYDLWGDAVNTASRMESHGVRGQVHVSEATYLAIRHRFAAEPRGEMEIKGKGPMRTYMLKG